MRILESVLLSRGGGFDFVRSNKKVVWCIMEIDG